MLIWNTTPITNKLERAFTGRYNGVDIILEPGKTRNLPSEVSLHLAQQLFEESRRNKEYNFTDRDDFLGKEIQTADRFNHLSFKDQIARHEEEFEFWIKRKEKESLTRIDAVNEIIKNV